MALRLYIQSYGSPGDTEHYDITSPATVTEWITAIKELEKDNYFIKVTPLNNTLANKFAAVNVSLVERALEV